MAMRRYCLNALIAAFLVAVAIDTLPQHPPALHRALTPSLVRLGINQDTWSLFAPSPDRVNTRISAEVTYRDGESRLWQSPDSALDSAWKKWVGHRHVEWHDHIANHKHEQMYEAWCRHIARAARPDFPHADRGAEVRVIVAEATIPSAENRPWPSFRESMPFDDRWILTIEHLE